MTTTIHMKTTNRILDLWAAMEAENVMGMVKRLYDSNLPYHLFATFTSGDRNYGIGVSFKSDIRVDIAPFNNLKEMRVSLYNDTSYVNSSLLVIELLSPAHRDTFSLLCENLINSVRDLPSEKDVVNSVINQLEKWRNLFDKTKGEGLSTEKQQGLFGELTFLSKFLKKNITTNSKVLDYWVGVDAALRDFQGTEWAVEVKTTATNKPQKVMINGERQLDESLLSELFLYHCSVEVSKHNGENLNEKISKIRDMLMTDAPTLSIFNEKIILAGYYDEDYKLYENRCYKIRDEYVYRVRDNFPRIKESELRNGVCDVSYSIILSTCDEYRIPENSLFQSIKKYE